MSNNTTTNGNNEQALWERIEQLADKCQMSGATQYVNQQAVRDLVNQLCTARGMPHTVPVVMTVLYLEWRARFLNTRSEVWVDDGDASLTMPWIEIDGELLDEEDFESGQYSELGKAHCLTYPNCTAADGDVVRLSDIAAQSRKYGFPVSESVVEELLGDHSLPSGSLDYKIWAQQIRMQLNAPVSQQRHSSSPVLVPSHEMKTIEDLLIGVVELLLDGNP